MIITWYLLGMNLILR